MKRLLLIAAAMCCALHAQVPVTPIVQPHMTFVNAVGLPCAGCQLYSYAAGTTTPLATYVSSSGTAQNPNPIILDASGGPQTPSGSSGGIWLGLNSYKLVLKDALGVTIWTADNINAGSFAPCGTNGTVQISNSGGSSLTCDSSITINTTNHTLNIGTLGAHYVTIGALGTPTSWTFDTTTPATALASLGAGAIAAGTINQLAIYPAAGSNIAGSSSIPDGITAITRSPSDNSTNPATTAYVASPGAINPTSVQIASGTAITDNQGDGTKVQHSTGTTTSGDLAKFDSNGNIVDAGITPPTDYYFSFTGCTLVVTGNSANCRGTAAFSSVTPAVPVQPDTNYYIGCTTYTTQPWGSSTGVNNVSTSSFDFAENVDRYNGVSATITPTVFCHLHHN